MRCRRRDPGHPEHQAPSGVWIATVTAWNSTDQAAKLAWVAKTSPRLHRAYLLEEGLRYVFKVKGEAGKEALDRWLGWAQRCRIPAFVELARKIKRHLTDPRRPRTWPVQRLIESVNTKIRLITRTAFGFQDPDALIALAMLSLGGYRPPLPGRH
jgi:transposase